MTAKKKSTSRATRSGDAPKRKASDGAGARGSSVKKKVASKKAPRPTQRKQTTARASSADNKNKAVLFPGEKAALKALKKGIKKFGEKDPIIQELMAHLLAMARGTGVLYRGNQTRYMAIKELLDRIEGKVVEKRQVEAKVDLTYTDLVLASMRSEEDDA